MICCNNELSLNYVESHMTGFYQLDCLISEHSYNCVTTLTLTKKFCNRRSRAVLRQYLVSVSRQIYSQV